jgi:hypothetical protein
VSDDGDCDERAALPAVGVEAPPDLVQSLLGFQEIATATAGCPSLRCSSLVPSRGGRR